MTTGRLDEVSRDYRREILEIIRKAGRGHIGPTFSAIEIIRVLYEDILRIDPARPLWEGRDRFILSKGHGCLALYVALARSGFFPRQELLTFCRFASRLGGHPESMKLPGIEASTGSLGHGLALAIGMAVNARLAGRDYRTMVLLGDGECDEGSIWEAAMCASKYKLDNLTAIIDYNKMQCYGETSEVMPLEPIADKWRSFGFAVSEVDGHDLEALRKTFREFPLAPGKPGVVICHTVKGKGVASIEGDPGWHHKIRLSDATVASLIQELEAE